ncbi:tRNA 2-thiocytidine biosynthesis protein TtcA [archaeon HR01]|nr:tRNA 2-thiocytidine biosynthesis protein TtcA [archaeon HR01]
MAEAFCSLCGGRPVYRSPYSGHIYCRACFVKAFEKRVVRTIAAYKMFRRDDRIAVAVSGGKDSLALLNVLARIERGFPEARLFAVTVDEGIEGYRDEAIENAVKMAERLEVPIHIVSFKELYGMTLTEILSSPGAGELGLLACSICGPLRRKAIYTAAKKLGATVVATAHTLDDIVQTYLLKTFRGELGSSEVGLRSEGPTIPRVSPFRLTPEREVVLYAYLCGIPFQTIACPNAASSMRGPIREFLTAYEEKHPGSLYAALRSFEKIPTTSKNLTYCQSCGDPSSRRICRVCELIQTLKHHPQQVR